MKLQRSEQSRTLFPKEIEGDGLDSWMKDQGVSYVIDQGVSYVISACSLTAPNRRPF